ncbi:MAG: superoxide dismutase family protein [Vicinamibacterales bacterium]
MRTLWSLAIGVALTVGVAAQSSAKADIKDAQGKSIGSATLTDTPHGILLTVNLTAAPTGRHAFHLHAVGKCEAPFTSAGGHLNPTGKKHGIKSADGAHAGDLPNVTIPAGGALTFEVLAHGVTMAQVMDADGTAVVMHQGFDDYTSDPAGAAGDRIACGVVTR